MTAQQIIDNINTEEMQKKWDKDDFKNYFYKKDLILATGEENHKPTSKEEYDFLTSFSYNSPVAFKFKYNQEKEQSAEEIIKWACEEE